jgi:phosphoribosylamine-glycine ligase
LQQSVDAYSELCITFLYIYSIGHDVISRWPEHLVFHSGTTMSADGNLVTNGGRVLIVIAIASELMLAAAKATKACGRIVFEGAQYRTDISHKGIARCDHYLIYTYSTA